MALDAYPMAFDEWSEAGTLALRSLPGRVVLELERRTDFVILRQMFLEMSVADAIYLQASLASAILQASDMASGQPKDSSRRSA